MENDKRAERFEIINEVGRIQLRIEKQIDILNGTRTLSDIEKIPFYRNVESIDRILATLLKEIEESITGGNEHGEHGEH